MNYPWYSIIKNSDDITQGDIIFSCFIPLPKQDVIILSQSCDIKNDKITSVVDFHRIFSIPKPFIKKIAGNIDFRLRLLPPYREHLSQAFARYFMRVGLPQDISKEEVKEQIFKK